MTPTTLPEQLRGFGPIGILAALVIFAGNLVFVPFNAILVLVWARWSQTPWRQLGYRSHSGWPSTVVAGVAIGFASKIVMKSIVMPLLHADPINHAYHYLVGNTAALPATVYLMIVGAGFGEETLFRGYMFERFGRLIGTGAGAKVTTVAITSVLFGLAHYPVQGLPGAQQGTIMGLVFGTIFALTHKIWIPMIAHAAFDLTALAIIFWDVESEVAHLVFK